MLEKKHGIIVPYPQPRPPKDSQYKVSYAKPTQFNVVGSYVSKTMVKSQGRRTIDMIVEMPKEIFQEKDYLNLRYFYKRAYYLAIVTAAVRKEFGTTADITYEYLNGNRLVPVLRLTPTASGTTTKKTQNSFHIRIIPCAAEGLFPKQKLLPTNSCIRAGQDAERSTQSPTPFYNSTLKAESCYLAYLKVIRQAEKACPSFKDACILGRIWLQQRGFSGSLSKGGFGHFEWAVLTALLLQGGGRKGVAALSPSLSSTQIFKALLQYLAAVDLSKKPLLLGRSSEGLDAARESGPVIFDSLRQLNVAYKMSTSSAFMLQQYAKWTHTSLADQNADQFNPTFIIKADSPLQCYDLLVRVEQSSESQGSATHQFRGNSWEYGDRVTRIMTKALGGRAELVHAQSSEDADNSSWDFRLQPPSASPAVWVGVVFNPANMARQVDQGPTVEEKAEAKKFRQFWGEKSELRRFKDGSILESLIWTQTTPIALCEEIVRYILKLHLHLQDAHLDFCGNDFLAVLPIKSTDVPAFQAARQAFSVFESDLRNLPDLPLQIRQIAATAPGLRSASIQQPFHSMSKGVAQPMDTVVYFEASGKWPENLAAIQRTKIAFLLRLGDLLTGAKPGLTCRVGLEEAETEIENLGFLDVLYEDGAAFRLRIHSDLEESLLERRAKDKTLEQRVRTEGAQLLASFNRLYTLLPLHTQTISTLCARFPALSPTIRLVKHWFDSHKLSCHFLEETIELFALKVFLEPYPWQAPSSAMTGFLRTLQFLSRWDWRTEALIVDASGDLSSTDRSAIETRLEAWRKLDPGMSHTTMFIATAHDTTGTAFTTHNGRPSPSKVVATRMTALARSACKLIRDQEAALEAKTLFQPSLKEYDVVIHLSGKMLKDISRGNDVVKQSQFKNLDGRTGRAPQVMIQQPARTLLAQLEALFSGPLLFFHGAPEDMVIAGIWNPQIQRRTFRVNLPCSFRPARSNKGREEDSEEVEELVEVNREGIVAEIARIGGDCIEKIETSSRS